MLLNSCTLSVPFPASLVVYQHLEWVFNLKVGFELRTSLNFESSIMCDLINVGHVDCSEKCCLKMSAVGDRAGLQVFKGHPPRLLTVSPISLEKLQYT